MTLLITRPSAYNRCSSIRHNYTKYEDRLIRLGFPVESDDYLYREAKAEAQEAVDEFLTRHR